jgi:hypothetical protein
MEDRTRESKGVVEATRASERSGPILGLRFSLSSSPWRLGAGWALLAGALTGQTPIWSGANLLSLGGSLLLADAVWGVFWRRTAPRSGIMPKRSQRARLPYCTAESPVTGFMGGLRNGSDQDGETGWPAILALLGATAVLSVLLGRPAIVLSVLALLSSVAARLTWKRGKRPALLMALLGIAFPWALGATLDWTGDLQADPGVLGASLALGAAFTVLAWSLHRVELSDSGEPVWLIWFGQIVVLATLTIVRAPMALAIVAGLLVVPCLLLSRRRYTPGEVADALRNSDPWWLASMLATALAVRF